MARCSTLHASTMSSVSSAPSCLAMAVVQGDVCLRSGTDHTYSCKSSGAVLETSSDWHYRVS